MMKRLIKGDTIIEVMMAITVFSGVIVMSLAIMNQGVASAQNTLEVTLARETINAQAETLRFIHGQALVAASADDDGYKLWNTIINNDISTHPPSDLSTCSPSDDSKAFLVNPRNPFATIDNPHKVQSSEIMAQVYPRILYTSDFSDTNKAEDLSGSKSIQQANGIWIEAVKVGGRAYDFHIRACWYAPGKSVPNTLGTVVRLYNPTDTTGDN